jgi:hypothetical protein
MCYSASTSTDSHSLLCFAAFVCVLAMDSSATSSSDAPWRIPKEDLIHPHGKHQVMNIGHGIQIERGHMESEKAWMDRAEAAQADLDNGEEEEDTIIALEDIEEQLKAHIITPLFGRTPSTPHRISMVVNNEIAEHSYLWQYCQKQARALLERWFAEHPQDILTQPIREQLSVAAMREQLAGMSVMKQRIILHPALAALCLSERPETALSLYSLWLDAAHPDVREEIKKSYPRIKMNDSIGKQTRAMVAMNLTDFPSRPASSVSSNTQIPLIVSSIHLPTFRRLLPLHLRAMMKLVASLSLSSPTSSPLSIRCSTANSTWICKD